MHFWSSARARGRARQTTRRTANSCGTDLLELEVTLRLSAVHEVARHGKLLRAAGRLAVQHLQPRSAHTSLPRTTAITADCAQVVAVQPSLISQRLVSCAAFVTPSIRAGLYQFPARNLDIVVSGMPHTATQASGPYSVWSARAAVVCGLLCGVWSVALTTAQSRLP